MDKKFETVFFLVTVVLVLISVKDWTFYTRPYDKEKVWKMYDQSQYVRGEDSIGIGDDALYAFSGYYYITGGDPSQVNFEHPPLGKYLIGLSIILFKNENIVYLIFAVITLWMMYSLGLTLYKSRLIGFFILLILMISPLFRIQFLPSSQDQYSVSLLDLPMTMFFTAGIYFLFINHKWKYHFSSGMWGLAFATKFFPGLLLLLPVVGFFVWKNDKKNIKQWLWSLLFIPLIYIFSYAVYFYYHPSIIEFIRFQKYTLAWRLGNPAVYGNIVRTIFSGSYKNWWDGRLVSDPEWNWVLPLVFSLASIAGVKAFVKKERNLSFLIWICWIYCIYVGINTVGIARYIVPVYPLLALLVPRALTEVIQYVRNKYT